MGRVQLHPQVLFLLLAVLCCGVAGLPVVVEELVEDSRSLLPARAAAQPYSYITGNTILWAPPPPPESDLNPPSGECIDGACKVFTCNMSYFVIGCTYCSASYQQCLLFTSVS